MNKKIICLTIITMFALSILPMSPAEDVQTAGPMKLTQEIDPKSGTLDSTDIVFAQSTQGNVDNPIIARARPSPQPKFYALTIEIDYIEGYEPTQSVLDYMKNYYGKQGIIITYSTGNAIPIDESFNDGISESEFWSIEKANNGGPTQTSSANGGIYTSPYKWALFGTSVEGSANTVGFTYCIGNYRDLVAGNYIFIADKAADDWALEKGVEPAGAEAVLLMHEFGHSIGICAVRAGSEVYCTNYYCVMSYLRTQNAGNVDQWYYCSSHWKTKNLDYYVV